MSNKQALVKFSETLDNVSEKIEQMRQEQLLMARKEFESSISTIFELIPTLKYITWNQYSPYFNDGDECVFSVNEVYAMSFIPEETSWEYEPETEDDFVVYSYSKEQGKLTNEEFTAIKALISFIGVNEDLMEDLFGNHTTVMVTAEGIETEDCNHD